MLQKNRICLVLAKYGCGKGQEKEFTEAYQGPFCDDTGAMKLRQLQKSFRLPINTWQSRLETSTLTCVCVHTLSFHNSFSDS